MKACAKDTCTGFGVNIKNNPTSFIRGKEDAALIKYMQTNGIYITPGASNAMKAGADMSMYTGNPFKPFIMGSNRENSVLSVEIQKKSTENAMIYNVYVTKGGCNFAIAKSTFSVSKTTCEVTPVSAGDIDISNAPVFSNYRNGTMRGDGANGYNSKLSKETNMIFNRAIGNNMTRTSNDIQKTFQSLDLNGAENPTITENKNHTFTVDYADARIVLKDTAINNFSVGDNDAVFTSSNYTDKYPVIFTKLASNSDPTHPTYVECSLEEAQHIIMKNGNSIFISGDISNPNEVYPGTDFPLSELADEMRYDRYSYEIFEQTLQEDLFDGTDKTKRQYVDSEIFGPLTEDYVKEMNDFLEFRGMDDEIKISYVHGYPGGVHIEDNLGIIESSERKTLSNEEGFLQMSHIMHEIKEHGRDFADARYNEKDWSFDCNNIKRAYELYDGFCFEPEDNWVVEEPKWYERELIAYLPETAYWQQSPISDLLATRSFPYTTDGMYAFMSTQAYMNHHEIMEGRMDTEYAVKTPDDSGVCATFSNITPENSDGTMPYSETLFLDHDGVMILPRNYDPRNHPQQEEWEGNLYEGDTVVRFEMYDNNTKVRVYTPINYEYNDNVTDSKASAIKIWLMHLGEKYNFDPYRIDDNQISWL